MITVTFTNFFLIASFFFAFSFIEGPFGILSKLRNHLMLNKVIGVFFFKLFACSYCLGFWAGITTLLLNGPAVTITSFFVFGLVGSAWSFLVDKFISISFTSDLGA